MHRYAIFSAHFEPHVGGIEAFTKNLATELAAEGNAVVVVTSQLGGDPAHETTPAGFEVVRLPAHLLMNGRLPISRHDAAYRRLWKRLVQWAPDRVLVNARFYRHSVEGLLLARETGAPAVVMDHGSAYLSLSQPLFDAALKVHEHLATARVKAFSPQFAGISKKSVRWLETFSIETDVVVNNAIDAPAFRALSSGRDFRGELGIPADAFVAASCGRMIPEKHPELVVAAAKRLPDVSFVLAGDGPVLDACRAQAAGARNLHFVGALGRSDVSALFSAADCLVLPTRSEGLPTVMLEAGAWGAPPVIPDVGGVEDVYGGTGLAAVMASLDEESLVAGVSSLASRTPEEREAGKAAVRRLIESEHSWRATVAQLDHAFHVAEKARRA